ncbi:hypothetical protein A2943_00765 [Candidatus Adlerbacteria bacterium RIFCSPLOWO2_01_FULL_51_16]|uniref:DUF5659 domain-containing protein n=1 Tax=Candidatus Adlerbacteria bacterium RIFCSPLOWO2_01_FULL_51_16 TaxID=1797243 RepID=A0A1F4XHS7_9BACT|nr:MAG: hypothetical protein A2943_00765 [Candidatus Adlerbacteria bacterium RIFCSPLOWO2_01_FULL_51_16]
MKSNTESQVAISDLGLAALLVTLQFELVSLERTSEKRVDFVFANSKEVERAIADFWEDKNVNVPIQTLFNNFRLLKNRLYAFK